MDVKDAVEQAYKNGYEAGKKETERKKKVSLALEKSLTSKGYWLVISEDFYVEIKKNQFYSIAEFLGINIGEEKMKINLINAKVGDVLIYSYRRGELLVKVEGFTDKGELKVAEYFIDERFPHSSVIEIRLATKEEIEEHTRANFVRKVLRRLHDADEISYDQAVKIMEILKKPKVCSSYHIERGQAVCYGTRECESCNCGGDTNECDFYPEKRGITK